MLSLVTAEPAALDRRHRRRLETIEEVLDHAVDLMHEEGVAGLSLGEIARRMGIRPPSLYVYFPSKHALYDALFQRGCELLLASLAEHDAEHPDLGDDLAAVLTSFGLHLARWSMTHPAYAQLMFWRPVPKFEPSAEAYEPATRFYAQSLERFHTLQGRGLIRSDADIDLALQQWSTIVAGVVSQQLSNAPDEPVDAGRFTAQLPALATMFAAHYASPRSTGTTTATPARRGHARKR